MNPTSEESKVPSEIAHLRELYCSEVDNLSRDFFVPCLRACHRYDRAAGYFSTGALRTWAGAIANLIKAPALRIRLIVSPKLKESDWQALRKAVSLEERCALFDNGIEDFLYRALLWEEASAPDEHDLVVLLAWLIASERLDLRFAFNLSEGEEKGIFHKKIGVFYFSDNTAVAFTGSANETWAAHDINSESVDVYRSWIEGENRRIALKQQEFDRCWNADPSRLLVREISPNLLERIRDYSAQHPPQQNTDGGSKCGQTKPSPFDGLWKHQKAACEAILSARSGILEMATGTGKTRTAMALLDYLFNEGEIEGAIIAMSGNDLLRQWEEDLRSKLTTKHDLTLLRSFSHLREEQSFLLNPRRRILLCSRENLQKVVKQLHKESKAPRMAIVHDEVHDLGSPGNRAGLQGHHTLFIYRIGLSATPERDYDDDGNAFIQQELGEVVFQYGLSDAITERVLCPFDYFVIPYTLTSEDKADRSAVYAKEAAAAKAGNPWPPQQRWIELSKVYKKARDKPPRFATFLENHLSNRFLDSTIVFVEDKEFGERLYPIIIKQTHRYSQYFDSDSPQILLQFSLGRIDCLITCHKLSQGIDLPALQNVVLFASQRGKRETIQRLGRCLRRNPKDAKKVACVLDFRLVGESEEQLDDGQDEERVLWLQELSRVRPPES